MVFSEITNTPHNPRMLFLIIKSFRFIFDLLFIFSILITPVLDKGK